LPIQTRLRAIESVLNEILGLHNKPKAAVHSALRRRRRRRRRKNKKRRKKKKKNHHQADISVHGHAL